MGHDIEPFCKHNLPTDNIINLGKALSERFNYRVACVERIWDTSPDLNENVLQVFNNETTYPAYNLYWDDDLNYDYKSYELCSEDTDSERYQWNYIYQDKVCIKHFYVCRWNQLCYFFLDTNEWAAVGKERYMNFRRELQYFAQTVGGDEVYLYDDQSKEMDGLGCGTEEALPWEELKQRTHELAGALLLDIPLYFLDEDYASKWKKGKQLPLAFFDDFRDLI